MVNLSTEYGLNQIFAANAQPFTNEASSTDYKLFFSEENEEPYININWIDLFRDCALDIIDGKGFPELFENRNIAEISKKQFKEFCNLTLLHIAVICGNNEALDQIRKAYDETPSDESPSPYSLEDSKGLTASHHAQLQPKDLREKLPDIWNKTGSSKNAACTPFAFRNFIALSGCYIPRPELYWETSEDQKYCREENISSLNSKTFLELTQTHYCNNVVYTTEKIVELWAAESPILELPFSPPSKGNHAYLIEYDKEKRHTAIAEQEIPSCHYICPLGIDSPSLENEDLDTPAVGPFFGNMARFAWEARSQTPYFNVVLIPYGNSNCRQYLLASTREIKEGEQLQCPGLPRFGFEISDEELSLAVKTIQCPPQPTSSSNEQIVEAQEIVKKALPSTLQESYLSNPLFSMQALLKNKILAKDLIEALSTHTSDALSVKKRVGIALVKKIAEQVQPNASLEENLLQALINPSIPIFAALATYLALATLPNREDPLIKNNDFFSLSRYVNFMCFDFSSLILSNESSDKLQVSIHNPKEHLDIFNKEEKQFLKLLQPIVEEHFSPIHPDIPRRISLRLDQLEGRAKEPTYIQISSDTHFE